MWMACISGHLCTDVLSPKPVVSKSPLLGTCAHSAGPLSKRKAVAVHDARLTLITSILAMTVGVCYLLLLFSPSGSYNWDYVMVFEVRAEDKELTAYQRKFSMKEILTRLNVGGKWETSSVETPLADTSRLPSATR